ncbi:MAG: hypothetical protein ACRDWD_09855, partial [Acidimicrobiia bacterium]
VDPSPTLTPPPAWSYDFLSSTESVEACACDGTSTMSSQVKQLAEGGFTFSQVIRGAARDSAGDLTWPISLQQWGEIGPDGGVLEYRFRLSSIQGPHLYWGRAVLAETITHENGSTVYRFEGTFGPSNPSMVPATGLPHRGFVSATVGVWQEGTIYVGSVSLQDAPTVVLEQPSPSPVVMRSGIRR